HSVDEREECQVKSGSEIVNSGSKNPLSLYNENSQAFCYQHLQPHSHQNPSVNTSSIKLSTVSEQLSTGSEQVSTVGAKKSTSSHDKGHREGKAPMISEETPKKSKEQILQEEASLAEAIRLDSLQKEKEAKQIHLDSLLAQRIAEEEELNEQ
ncbi:hypothetical protein Tco_0075981, partial [Tanacetum coccineum]